MKKANMKALLTTTFLVLGLAWFSPSAVFAQNNMVDMPVPTDQTTGGEEKKKPQPEGENTTQEEAQTPSSAKGEVRQAPATTPTPPVRETPRQEDTKVNSFNFLFEMLYHFNVIETSKLYNLDDPSQEQFIAGMPIYHGGTAIVSY